jgi:hypothetical protein
MHEERLSVETFMLRRLSPPKDLADPYRRYYFSVFYSVAHCFTFMNAIIFWGLLVPYGRTGFERLPSKQPGLPIPGLQPGRPEVSAMGTTGLYPRDGHRSDTTDACFTVGDILGNDWQQPFSIFNQHGATVLVSLVEITMLNSIPPPFVRQPT